MLELFEKAVFTAIGAATITHKKVEDLIVELSEKYKMTADEGKLFIERIQLIAKESTGKMQEIAELEVQKVINRLGLVSREEFDSLLKRVNDLERERKVYKDL